MKAEIRKPYVFTSISELMKRLEQPKPLHPLIAVVNYDTVNVSLADAGTSFSLNFYKISFKHTFKGQVKYGQGYYDFEEGGLACLAPNQVVTMSGDERSYDGYTLYFHPDFMNTCYQWSVEVSYKKLVEVFGKETTNGDGFKTQAEWFIYTPAGVATIYDYKQGKSYNGAKEGIAKTKVTDWHIGGFNKEVVPFIIKALQM